MNVTPEHITTLKPHEVFVFGSNRSGRHGRGAAKTALKWGARNGEGYGLMGQTYGIPTKGRKLEILTVAEIGVQVSRFLRFAKEHPELHFLVTQIGCGLAGNQPKQIAPLFFADGEIPSNVSLPECFWKFEP